MKIDAYTKAVLTVIAGCLVWICLNGTTPAALAQAGRPEPTQVILVDAKGTPIYTSEGFRVNFAPKPIPVSVTNASLPVDVTNPALAVAVRAIQRTTAWDPINVQVMRDPPAQKPGP